MKEELQSENRRLRAENERLHKENERLHVENERLRLEVRPPFFQTLVEPLLFSVHVLKNILFRGGYRCSINLRSINRRSINRRFRF